MYDAGCVFFFFFFGTDPSWGFVVSLGLVSWRTRGVFSLSRLFELTRGRLGVIRVQVLKCQGRCFFSFLFFFYPTTLFISVQPGH